MRKSAGLVGRVESQTALPIQSIQPSRTSGRIARFPEFSTNARKQSGLLGALWRCVWLTHWDSTEWKGKGEKASIWKSFPFSGNISWFSQRLKSYQTTTFYCSLHGRNTGAPALWPSENNRSWTKAVSTLKNVCLIPPSSALSDIQM